MNIMLNGREVIDAEVNGVDSRDFPDFADAYLSSAAWADSGEDLNELELEQLEKANPELVYELAYEQCQCAAEFYSYSD